MNLKKSISLVLTLCMVFSLFATFVFPVAAEGTTYTMINTVEDLVSGTYYMAGYIEKDGKDPYQLFNGIGSGKCYTTGYTYADGVLATTATQYLAELVEVAAVEGKENTYTLYMEGKGYITCTDATQNHKLNFSDTACEWEAYANANGGINFKTTVGSSVAHMGTNDTSSSQFIRQYKDSSAESSLSYGLVFFAEDVEEAPVTSQVVTNWNTPVWGSAAEAHIFTDQEAYFASQHTWWAHVSFKPTDEAGIYEVVARRGATGEGAVYQIAEGGFIWLAHDQAAEGTPGAYAHALMQTLNVGDRVIFTGLDIANCTTTEDATAEKYIAPIVAKNVALNKGYKISGCGEPYGNYTANLTDGQAEQAYALNDSWFAFYNNGTHPGDNAPDKVGSIIIDLGDLYDVESINVNALDAKGSSGINAPAGFKAYFSKDGENWGEAVTLNYTLPDAAGAFVAESAVTARAQFVKVEVTLNGVFAFINEIEVYGILAPFEAPEFAGENVALNKGYTYPTANLYYHWSEEWPCTDNVATALTDGVRPAGYYGKGETSGWGGATPRFVDIVIDLEAVYDISGFAYVLTGGADGILHPASVEILVSDDNVTFTPVSVKTISGNQYFGESWSPCYDLDYYATPAAAVAGRYVKFIFNKAEGTNFIFINELEVYGTEAVVEEEPVAGTVLPENLSQCGSPYGDLSVLLDGYTGVGEVNTYSGFQDKLFGIANANFDETAYSFTVVFDEAKTFNTVSIYALDYYGGCVHNPADLTVVINGVEYDVVVGTNPGGISESVATLGEEVTAKAITVKVVMGASDQAYAPFNMFTEVAVSTEAVEEDDDSFKDSFTYVDGVNNGTAQSREDGWESIPVVDFWYDVIDGVDTITIKVAVDNKKVVEEDTLFRVWIDADLSTTNARTTLIDTKVKDGAAYVARVDAEMGAAILEQTYSVIGNDYFFTLVLDKAVLGIDGQYGLDLQLAQTGHNTLHSIEWDAFDNSLVPWSTTEFYEVFGDADTFKDTYTHVDGETVGTTQSRGEGWESLLVPDFWYVVEDGETEVTIKVAVDNRVIAADDTMLRVWLDADPSDTARTTLIDTKVKDGAAYVARVDGGLDAAILSQTYSVIGNDYFLTVVLDKAALGIDGQYGMMLTLSETGYNSMHNVAWDVEDVAGAAPWNTTKDYILYGEAPEVEYNEVVVDVNANEMLTDGKTGFAGGWNVGADANKVLLIANGKCTTNPMKVVVNYALGETKAIDALVLDFYHCAAVMIGYPEGQVLVEYSVDGVEYTEIGLFDLEAVTLSTAADGTVSSTLAFDAVDAAYVRATFVVGSNKDVLGDSPADGKIFWEFAALAEVAVNEVVAPEYNEGWNAEFDADELKLFKDVALFGDGKWGEDATAFGHADVILVQNLVCKNPDLYPEFTLVYNAGEAIDVNNIKVGLYAETNSMIGFPSKDAKVYVSNDGIEWTLVESTNNIPESVFVQHHDPSNSLGTSIIDISFADTTAQYVKVVFTYTDSPFNDPNGDYKPVYEFIGFTEAEVSYVESAEELPEEATGLDYFGYTHTHINYVMYVDADMTLGELVTKYFGQSKDLNYFKVIVVNEDGTVAATYLTLGRPDGVKTDIAVTAGQYVLALSADGSNEGRFEIADTVKVGDIVTLYNVDFTAEPGELTNAGFIVEAAVKDLPSGRGFEVLVPANGSVSYVVNFTNGADFLLYDTSVTVLVNGVALDASEGYYEAKLEKGDVVTFENATGEDIAVYPMAFPVIYGTMSNPFVLEELGDLTADITMDLIMNGGAAHYIYIAPADGKVTITMLDASWTYTVNNLTAGLYGDSQWSDSDPVLKSYTIDVSAGDEIQIIVGTYDAENPWTAPEGKVNFTVAFEAAKTFVTGEFSEGGELNKANAFAANAHNIWNKDFSGNSWWGVTVLEWNAEENAWEVVKVLLSGADAKDGTLTETQIALAAHVDNAAAYASITALQVGDLVYIWDAGVATTDKLVDGVDANGGFYTTDPEKTGTTALTYKKVEFLAGDANMNGKIDANDYATIRKLVVGSLTAEDVDAKTLELADVNGNGKIDANDYILAKRHVLGTYTIPAWEEVE